MDGSKRGQTDSIASFGLASFVSLDLRSGGRLVGMFVRFVCYRVSACVCVIR